MNTAIAFGKEGKVQFSIMDGQVKISIGFEGADASAGAFVMASPDQICKALGDIIPGDSSLEHTIVGGLKLALNAAMDQSQAQAQTQAAPAAPADLPAGTVVIK